MDTSTKTPKTGQVNRLVALALAAGTLSLLGTTAFAQNSSASDSPSVTVTAPRVVQRNSVGPSGLSQVHFSQTRVVSYADLNLDTPEGRVALHERIRANATAACKQMASAHPFLIWSDDVPTCVHQAMLTWMPRVHGVPAVAE